MFKLTDKNSSLPRLTVIGIGLISILIGLWCAGEALIVTVHVAWSARTISVLSLYQGIVLMGMCMLIGGIFLLRGSISAARIPFAVAALFSLIRWLKNWDSVFPFNGIGIYSTPHQSLLISLWQKQHFPIAVLALAVAVFVTLYKKNEYPIK